MRNLSAQKRKLAYQQSKLIKPIFTDQYTEESIVAKERVYRQMSDGGIDLYELRIKAHIVGYSHQVKFDQWEQHNFTFNERNEAVAYAEAFPMIVDIKYLHDFTVEIYKFPATALNEQLVLTAETRGTDQNLVWKVHNNQTLPRLLSETRKQLQPLYIDKCTPGSARERKQLYEQYRQKGDSLYELRVTAEVLSEVVLDDGVRLDSACSQVTYTFTFPTFAEAETYAEKIYSDSLKYPDIPLFDEHHASLGFVWRMMLSNFHIVEISPTEREIPIMSAYFPDDTIPSTIPWESDEDVTELKGQAA